MGGGDFMKKVLCILLTFLISVSLFACSKNDSTGTTDVSADNSTTAQTASESISALPESEALQITEQLLCSVPTKPVDNSEFPFTVPEDIKWDSQIHLPAVTADLCAAYEAMNKNEKFRNAALKNYQRLNLGEIGGENCVRILLETENGDFVAVVNESCEILSTWAEGETKTTEFWFPHLWDASNAMDENLSIAFHTMHADEHYKDAVICDFEQNHKTADNGKHLYEVKLRTTHGDFAVLITEFGEVVSVTK